MNSKITQFTSLNAAKSLTFSLKSALKTIFIAMALSQATPLFSQTVPAPPTNVTASPSAVCPSSPYTFLKASSPGNTIKWYTVSTGGTSIGSSASGASFYVNVAVPTTYFAESVTPAAVASAVRTAIEVAVNTAPIITYMPPDVQASNASGQCGTIVTYPSASAIGTPTPNVIYSDSSGSNFDGGSTTVIVSAVNVCATTSLSFDVTVNDVEVPGIIPPPDMTFTAPSGSTSVVNPNLGIATAYDNCGVLSIYNDAPAIFPAGNTTVTWTTIDYNGNKSTSTQIVTVEFDNLAPVLSSQPTSSAGSVIAAGKSTSLTVNWSDEAGPYNVSFNWNDGSPNTELTGVTENSATASHAYSSSGVYEPIVTVTDGAGASTTTTCQYISVYVTGNDFTTAGGFFNVSPGFLVSNPSATGKVNMGSNCKPKTGGGFQGELELNFKEGNFNFKTSKPANWEYLIISNCYFAIFKGSGTVNGSGNYGILVAQTDKTRNPSNANNIRIKIWNKNAGDAVVFDTQPGAPDNALPLTPMANGTIKIHTDNSCASKSGDWDMQNANEVLHASVFPNPFANDLKLNLNSESNEKVAIAIYDLLGKAVQNLEDVEANTQVSIPNNLSPGIYYVRLTQAGNTQVIKVIKTEN